MSTEFERVKIRLNKFTAIMGTILFLSPLILWLIDGQVRPSISNYAYMQDHEWFFALISIAGAVFIMDGSIWNKRWYNIVLGCALVGVALTPHLKNDIVSLVHFSCAGLFFIGSIIVMIVYSSAKQRLFKIGMGTVIVIALLLHFLFPVYELFWAEWIGMIPITIHFLGEALNKLD